MVYLLYGTKQYRINQYIKKLSKNTDNINISKYDLNNDDIKNVIDDCETYSMFCENKIVILDNANMFTGSSEKSEELEKYLKNINKSTILILIVHAEKIDNRKKITTLIKTKGKVVEFNENINTNSLVKKLLDGYTISSNNINLLIDRVGNNPLTLENEIKKIQLYKDDKVVDEEDIIKLTSKNVDIDIFKLIDDIIKKNKEEAIEIYHKMLKINEEPLKIVIMLANQFRIMYQSKGLLMKGYTEKDIASILKIHPYRVKLAIQNSRSYSSDVLLKYINDLADIDYGIKTGELNKDLASELFILK